MNPHDRLRISVAAARYLEALEYEDDATLATLWQLAANDPEMIAAFQDINAGLFEEEAEQEQNTVESKVAAATEKYLPSAEIVRPMIGLVTSSDVATEIFRHTPDRLSAEAHAFNEKLRAATDALPADLGLSQLTKWAEARYGSAPAEYWAAFRQTALKVRMRRSADTEFQLATRRTPLKREET